MLKNVKEQESGSVAILSAVFLIVFLWCAALAVDFGSLYFERRTAQGAVDLAAIAAAQNIASADAAATATIEANNIRNVQRLVVTPGHYSADPSKAPDERFVADVEPFNAVRVQLTQNAPLYLAGALTGQRNMTIETQAIAVTTAQAAFSIGSRLLRLEGGLLNALLEGLLGGSVNLSVMDYEQLVDANVKLFQFMNALSTELDVDGASYNDVLAMDASVGAVLEALTNVSADSGQGAAAHVLSSIGATTHAADAMVSLGALVDLGPYGNLSTGSSAPGFDPSINVMQMVTTAASLANGSNQVSLNLGATIPGLTNVQVNVAIGEPQQDSPWLSVGERDVIVRTAQTRIRLLATVGAEGLVSVRVPLYAEVAYAEGRLDNIVCGNDVARDARVDIAALPGVAELWLGEVDVNNLDNFSRTLPVENANLVQTPLAKVSGKAHAAITNTSETVLSFNWAEIEAQETKSTSTREPTTTLLNSLLRDLDLRVEVLGLGIGLPGNLGTVVANLLSAATPALDRLLSGVLDALGISLGEADITVHGVRCDGAALVG
ncbi:Uncharacterized membrane protein [Filomicrobium insigne]|uniref:Uncharacterized membrane protein n=1 Tax=Filomicrobium insigne TaxID=418854 RepID=A0A1H0GW02_9HYPH|nr:TadG family pilus assembly protein [Filomicrobium insigne]SDO10994.1 Uncharacterized membrane protein [Filomicrobium insigne]